MKLRELVRDLKILETAADPEMEITGLAYDSRAVKPGYLFVAVRGFTVDGHKYIGKARENGAAVVLCEEAPGEGIPFLRVEDCRLALALCSRTWFGDPASEMCMIGFTGTNGKTTSCFLMKHLLEETLGAKVGLIGTNGIMIGQDCLPSERTTPESYELHRMFRAMRDAGCTHVVMEVSSHSLTLERVAGIRFQVGVFTNLTQDHLDFHRTMDEYARAKRRLFSQTDRACVNMDDPWAGFMLEDVACPVLRYSAEHPESELSAKEILLSAEGVSFDTVTRNTVCRTGIRFPTLACTWNRSWCSCSSIWIISRKRSRMSR